MRHNKVLISIGLILLSLTTIFAQEPINNPYQEPVFTQSSPEVAAFKRYGDVPVSLYSGVPDIGIPLYTVKLKDLEVPISLSYHAGGITVDQEATIVGLGWNLVAGGNITVSPIGSRETTLVGSWEETIDYIAGNTSGIVNTSHEDPVNAYGCASGTPSDDVSVYGVSATNGLGELDLYRVSLPSQSFTFIIHPGTLQPIFVGEKNKCKVEINSNSGANWNFIITDGYGVKYYFTIVEFDNDSNMPNSWYLTKITDVHGNEIHLEYKNYGYITPLTQLSESVRGFYPSFTPPRSINYSNGSVENYYLTAIKTNTEKVSFEYEQGRKDLQGEGKRHLKNITVIDSVDQTNKIRYKFNYGYFTASTLGGDFTADLDNDPPFLTDSKSLRLKLESLSQVNPLDSLDTLSHVFVYDERYSLPQKTSFAKDFWGYFNGQENASTLYGNKHTSLPNPVTMKYIESDFDTIDWEDYYSNFDQLQFANRFSSPAFMGIGTMKSIAYPTGGRTEFEFEPHDFRDQPMFEAADQAAFDPETFVISVSDMNDPYGYTTYISDTIVLNTATKVHLVGGGDSTQYDLSSGTIGIIDLSGGTYMYDLGLKSLWDVELELPAGLYKLVSSAPSEIEFQNYEVIVWANLTYKEFDYDAINSVLSKTKGVGGGLRVKTIKNYDENNNLVGQKDYSYQLETGESSGKLLRIMDNLQTLTINTGYEDESGQGEEVSYKVRLTDTFTFHANNLLSTHNSTVSNTVGYDRVVVRQVAGATNLGEEISYFVNDTPMKIGPYFSIYQNSTNGQLKEKVMLNQSGDTVQYHVFHYSQEHYAKSMLNIKAVDTYYGPSGGCAMHELTGNPFPRFNVVVYANTNFVNQLVKTETYDFSGSNKFLTTIENVYDTTNYQLDQTSILTSESKLRISQYTYPHDYPNDLVYPLMVEDNILNPVIEKKEYIDDRLLKTQENKFWFWLDDYNAMHIIPGRVKIGFDDNPLEDKIFFDKYDPKGNVVQYHKADETIKNVFYRGYGDNRVVAKIVSELGYDEVVSSADTYLNQLDDNLTNSQLESINTALRNLLPNALITTYTYDPLLGIKTETDVNGRTTYYEYDVFGRLMLVKDHDGNILKQFKYNYYKQVSAQQ